MNPEEQLRARARQEIAQNILELSGHIDPKTMYGRDLGAVLLARSYKDLAAAYKSLSDPASLTPSSRPLDASFLPTYQSQYHAHELFHQIH